ncbi:Sin-like protein conserved region-domain-containing protein [Entophlyctis helioformis]|nr:Sin-like protein conserved region-domain-containing protein [Entophlyctis helioformis]
MADDEDDDQYGSANERRVPDADNDDNDDDQYLDDDPDDPIVQEIDVYLANDISESLYMLQFPTRPMPFTPDVLPKVGRIKYKTKKVQLDVLLDPTGDHYDRDQGERFGNGLDNRPLLTAFDVRDGLNNNGPRQKLDAIKLESRIVPLNAQYMVGYLKAGEDALHLRPLSTVLQLRPSLDYIDKISEKEKTASQRIMYEERKEAEGVEEEAKAIQVIVRGADDKDAARKASLAELQRAMDNEPWTQLSVFGPEDENSEYFRSLLGETEAEPIQFTSTSASYLDTISPVLTDDAPSVEASLIGSRAEAMRRPVAKMGMSLAAMNKLPVVERIKAFLVNAHVVQFGPMYEAIGQGIPEAEFIQALKEVAFLIRGVWVGRSDLLYTGRPYDARRYLLMLFLEHEYVQRSVFAETSHMPPIMALNMLGEIADFHSGLGWQFKVPADEDFVAKHPALVAQQAAAVRADGEGAMQAMKPLDRIKNRRQSQASREAAAAAAAAAAGSKANRLDGAVIDTKASAAAQTTELLKRLFTFDSVYSKDYLVKSILSHKRREKSLSRDISEATIMASVAANCEQINDVFVLKLTGDAKQDEFRPIVIELFKKQAAVKKVDLMEQFTKVLGKQPASTLYTKLMQDIAIAERGSGNWTLKPSPAPPSES